MEAHFIYVEDTPVSAEELPMKKKEYKNLKGRVLSVNKPSSAEAESSNFIKKNASPQDDGHLLYKKSSAQTEANVVFMKWASD